MGKEGKKPDRRTVKTKRAIRNAFAELLSQKDLDEITVTDIADTADVNRKTVYSYYNGIYEILDEIENELVRAYQTLIEDLDVTHGLSNPYRIFESLTVVLSSDMEFYSRLMKLDGSSRLVRKIIRALEDRLKEELAESKLLLPDTIDLVVTYVVPGMLSAYQQWFNSGREQPIEEFSKAIGTLVLSGTEAFQVKPPKP